MNRDPVACPRCGLMVAYNRPSCPSGHFFGFPNVRFAQSMRLDLDRHYNSAISLSTNNNTIEKIRILETILSNSVATITTSPKVVRNMSSGIPYSSYYTAIADGVREIAKAEYHKARQSVDSAIHTGYEADILNAQVSVTGRGLPSYDKLTIVLKDVAIADRASVLRENAFQFYERNNLGRIGAEEEPGWRSVWTRRAVLGVAHLASDVTPATATEGLADLVSIPSPDRQSDKFIEVHIFGQLDWQAIDRVGLEAPLTSAEDQNDWDFVRQKLGSRGVACTDRTQ